MAVKSDMPPKLSFFIIQFLCQQQYQEEILGDLEEYYVQLRKRQLNYKAFRYWYHTFNFIRLYALKIPFKNSIIGIMFKLNLLVAIRSLLRNKFYSFINIFGLALGLTMCMFIAIFVINESSYDKHWKNSKRIYRVVSDLKFNDNEFNMSVTPSPMANSFREEFPELTAIGRMQNGGGVMAKVGENYFDINQIAYADHQMLDIFKFPLVHGTTEGLLTGPADAMISASTSEKLFGETNTIGKTFEIDGTEWEVKAVYEDIPQNTHFHYDIMMSMERHPRANSQVWLSNNFRTYILLDENNNPEQFESKLPLTIKKYVGPQIEQISGATMDEFLAGGGRLRYYLQPVESIHLESDLQIEIEANGDIRYVYIFIIAGIFVLAIAIINFMNISTARSSLRAKEVGLRKVIGSKRGLLIGQFITESMLNTVLAMVLAVAMLFLVLPIFRNFTEISVGNPLFGSVNLWDDLLISLLVIGLLSGIYPAFYLSSFIPIKVLKGNLSLGLRSGKLRNMLVVLQFSASVILIFGALVIYSQMNYTMQKSLGFEKDQALVINDTYWLGSKVDAFKNELLNNQVIENATMSSFLPVTGSRSDSPLMPEGMTNVDGAVSFQNWPVDENYIPTLKIKLVEGRNYDPSLASDSSGIIINQTAVKRLGLKDPIGKKLKTIHQFDVYGRNQFTIIGVVEDFHIDNFKSEIWPVALILGRSTGAITVRFQAQNTQQVMDLVEQKWEDFSPNVPLSYIFMDQQFEDQYASDQKLGTLFNLFAGLAIFIACLGLFGLAAFTTDQRKKEIGIRKVLGASIPNLMTLQLSGYTKLLIVSILVSLPVAWYVTKEYFLQQFIYRTDFTVAMFVLPGLIILLLAWATVSLISYGASRKNPVENLKYE